jgi:ABC-type transport system substrate-binding protein
VIERPVTHLLAHRSPNNVCGTEVDAGPNPRVDRVTVEATGGLIVSGERQSRKPTRNRGDIQVDVPAKRLEEITTRYPERSVSTVDQATWYMTLNTRVRPFDDERVRRAVNFAVDREEMVDIFGGPNLASETCQVLPPNFPSYPLPVHFRPVCRG